MGTTTFASMTSLEREPASVSYHDVELRESSIPSSAGIKSFLQYCLQAIWLYAILALQYIGVQRQQEPPKAPPPTTPEHCVQPRDQTPQSSPTGYSTLCQAMWAALDNTSSPAHSPGHLVSIESPVSWKQRRDRELRSARADSLDSMSFLELRSGSTLLNPPGAAPCCKPAGNDDSLVEVSLESPPATPDSPPQRVTAAESPQQRWAGNLTAVVSTEGGSNDSSSLKVKYERAKEAMLGKLDTWKAMLMT